MEKFVQTLSMCWNNNCIHFVMLLFDSQARLKVAITGSPTKDESINNATTSSVTNRSICSTINLYAVDELSGPSDCEQIVKQILLSAKYPLFPKGFAVA
jgi:hypothetical protein